MEEHNRSFEPMDVDLSLSTHSNSKMDISCDDIPDELKQERDTDSVRLNYSFETAVAADSNLKKVHIQMQKNVKCRNFMKTRLFTTLFVLMISLIVMVILNVNCSEEVNLENLKNTLSRQLVGQPKAIDSIIESLKEREKSKIIFFYGGTGVGKTFTASLLMDNFGYSSNLYHYTLPSFIRSMSSDLMIGLILCSNSLIVIDDCDITDMNIPKEVYDLIMKSENLGKNITIILVYNCDNVGEKFVKKCDENFHLNLLKTFSNLKVTKKLIKFEPLSEIHLRKCIEKEIGNRSINEHGYEKISKNFDVTVDGCKGVHTKIKLLNFM